MSKGNIFMGQSRGKLGDIVQYRAAGQQRQRGYNSTNTSKSYGQQAQRSRLKSSYNYYKNLQAVIKTGFVNGSAETSPYNRFMAKALPIAPYLIKSAAEAGRIIPAPFEVAVGGLPQMFTVETPAADGNLELGISGLASTDTTIGNLYDKIVGNAPCLYGKELLLIAVNIITSAVTGETGYVPTIQVFTYNLLPNSTELLSAYNMTASTDSLEIGDVEFSPAGLGTAFIGVVENGVVRDVNNAKLELTTDASTAYSNSITEAAARAAAESYGAEVGTCTL